MIRCKKIQLNPVIDEIHSIVKDIRKDLCKLYDVYGIHSLYKDYTGLCNIASDQFCKSMIEYLNNNKKLSGISYSVGTIHGEQKHLPNIQTLYWGIQHTWCYVKLDNTIIYVDITSEQFKSIYPNIPDYYVSYIKPKWFYPDKNNPAFCGILGYINNHISIKHNTLDRFGNSQKVQDGIIEFFQYNVWGYISDKIYEMIHGKYIKN